jgi:hypothetical protein
VVGSAAAAAAGTQAGVAVAVAGGAGAEARVALAKGAGAEARVALAKGVEAPAAAARLATGATTARAIGVAMWPCRNNSSVQIDIALLLERDASYDLDGA